MNALRSVRRSKRYGHHLPVVHKMMSHSTITLCGMRDVFIDANSRRDSRHCARCEKRAADMKG